MDISFQYKKLAKTFNSGAKLVAQYGPKRANKIRVRMAELGAASSLMDFWPPKSKAARCHELNEGKRKKQFQLSVDLDHPYRLIFIPNHDPIPLKEGENSLDWSKVTAVTILRVEDTHDGKN